MSAATRISAASSSGWVSQYARSKDLQEAPRCRVHAELEADAHRRFDRGGNQGWHVNLAGIAVGAPERHRYCLALAGVASPDVVPNTFVSELPA